MFGKTRKFNKLVEQIDSLQSELDKKVGGDAMYDPLSSRGDPDIDKVARIYGRSSIQTNARNLANYIGNGFAQNIVDIPAEDATREGIEIFTSLDVETDIPDLIAERMEDLKIRNKIKELVRYSRMYAKGSFLYYAVSGASTLQDGSELANPLPEEFKDIEFINVVDKTDSQITLKNQNQIDFTKENYNVFDVYHHGQKIHPSRYSWLVNSFIPEKESGLSVIQTCQDSIKAQDNGLWSAATILNTLAVNVFKSDEVAGLSPSQKRTLTAKIKHLLITHAVMVLKGDEEFSQLQLKAEGAKDIFDFIFDNMAGLSRLPKNILLGKAHGVVTAGEYDTLNHYANIARFQENELRPVYKKIIDLIVAEQNGKVYPLVRNKDIKITFEFKNLWKLDPMSEADVDLKESQRDQLDIVVGKVAPSEARSLDDRYKDLEPYSVDRNVKDMNIPEGDQ